MDKQLHAITINDSAIKRFKLKSIDSVKEYVESFNPAYKVYVVSAERTDGSNNSHYHILCSSIEDYDQQLLWANKIWNDEVDNEIMYYEYITKDGNFKLYNDYQQPKYTRSKDEYKNLMNDIYIHDLDLDKIRVKYPKLYVRHYKTILEMMRDRDGGKL